MQTFVLNANDKGRALVLSNLHAFADRLPSTKSWEWTCKRHVKERSDKQNAGLWAVAYPPLVKHTGYQSPELHDVFCRLFFGETAMEVAGMTVRRASRTTTTNQEGKRDVIPWDVFCRFYELVQQHGAEMGVDIPNPDPLWRENKEAK